MVLGYFLLTGMAVAQDDSPGSSAPAAVVPAPATEPPAAPEDKRIFGVLPNYRTAEASVPFAHRAAEYEHRL